MVENADYIIDRFGEPSNISTNKPALPESSVTKSVSETIEKVITFDCAKTYDQYRDIYYQNWDPNQQSNSAHNYKVQLAMSEQENLLLEYSCLEKKEEWAYKSKYESEIWGTEKEMTFDQCVEDYRSKYCIFMDESYGDDYIECQRITYQNALDACRKYQ